MIPSLHCRSWLVAVVAGVLALMLGLPGLGAPAAVAQEGSPPPNAGLETLHLIENTIVPPRDRIDLARRLLGVTDIPAPPTVAPRELEVGETLTFWADNLDEDFAFQVEAELMYKTDHVYMFVERGQQVDRAALARSAENFENLIRPQMHEFFGSEWFPGVDGDPHLYILHATNLGRVAAYYGSSSQYPVEAVAKSNEHEMFFVSLDAMNWAIGTDYYESVLAHEFQHMIHWYVDQNEDTWLNEGLSELAAMLTGYGSSGFVPRFLDQPAIQLNTWPEDGYRPAHYGAAFMFVAYFYERYGDEATMALVQNPANGLASVEQSLRSIDARDPLTGAPVGLQDLFADWVAANWLRGARYGDGRYTYTHPDMQDLPRPALTATLLPDGQPSPLDGLQWNGDYLLIPSGQHQRLQVTFEGQDSVSIVPAEAHSGQLMWWSNRADDSDARLTRAFDLSGVSRATLTYWTWYHIEHLWDYGYVMVSTDDGETWTALDTARMTHDDPHGNAYGPGYTGQSDGWVQERIDLTPYAGQRILLRFEYITDDAVTQPGMLVDDVAIPEIGYAEDFEHGDGGWEAEGWVRMDNVLPQRFLVQAIQPSNVGSPVARWLGEEHMPAGTWELTVGGDAGDVVLAVSGVAPVTTEPARYTVTVTPLD